jgi:hypothetical protein
VRLAAAAALAVLAGACGGASAGAPADPALVADVDALVLHVAGRHVDPWHAIPRGDFEAAAGAMKERLPDLGPDAVLVELMRLVALLGERDGHSGIFPLDPSHARELHLYPLRLYAFPDGLRVVGQVGGRDLVGAALLAVGGRPAGEVAAAVRPLVPRDNEHSREARLAQWLVVAEVLHGLGVTDAAGPAAFRLRLPDGREVERTLAPVPASRWTAAADDLFHPMIPLGLPRRPAPAWLARRLEPAWAARVDGGRAVHVAFNAAVRPTHDLGERVRRLAAARSVRGVVVDLRHNPGGENRTYEGLLRALVALPRSKRIAVLTSRTTFSAAANFLADLERARPIVLVGEPSGGSPNLVGDPTPVALPHTGWVVHVGTVWWRKSRAGARDPRTAFEPHVRVALRWADVAAGRDPALAAALARLRR